MPRHEANKALVAYVARVRKHQERIWKKAPIVTRWLHGLREAASGWEDHFGCKLLSEEVRRDRAAPTTFFHSKTEASVVV